MWRLANLSAYGHDCPALGQEAWRRVGGSSMIGSSASSGLQAATMPWSEINPSLMAATVLSNSGGSQPRSCPHCLSPDHSKEECAVGLPVSGTLQQCTCRVAAGAVASVASPMAIASHRITSAGGLHSKVAASQRSCRYDHICSGCHKPLPPHCKLQEQRKGSSLETTLLESKGQPRPVG